MTAGSDLQTALSLFQQNRLVDADAILRRILVNNPKQTAALNLTGAVAQARGMLDSALLAYNTLLEIEPQNPVVHYNRAFIFEEMKRPDDAANGYLAALRLQPRYRDARLNLANVYTTLGRHHDAAAALQLIVSENPKDIDARLNLGIALVELERGAEAEIEFRQILTLDPSYHAAHHGLALALKLQSDCALAVDHCRQALRLSPSTAEYVNTIGLLHLQLGQPQPALEAFERAAAMEQSNPRYLNNLGAAAMTGGNTGKAIDVFRRLVEIAPDSDDALFNLASALSDEERLAAAIDVLQRLLRHNADYADGHYLLAKIYSSLGFVTASKLHFEKATALAPENPFYPFSAAGTFFGQGRYADGWASLERRFDLVAVPKYRSKGVTRRPAPPPHWAGEDLSGRSLLLWAEQGIGDEILFAGLVPDLLRKCPRVALTCSPRLGPVFQRSFPGLSVLDSAAALSVVKDYDFQIAACSAGRFLRPDAASFPQHRGYLSANAQLVSQARERYGQKRNIGLSWRSHIPRFGSSKSIPFAALIESVHRDDVRFVNLQYGEITTEICTAEPRLRDALLIDQSIDPLVDMDAFFAQVAAMDLVITTSNTTAHVAGALGVPTWLILPEGSGALWYWFPHRSASPWYPSMRLFAGRASLDPARSWWFQPLRDISSALAAWVLANQTK